MTKSFTMPTDKSQLRMRFHELRRRIGEVEAVSTPIRQQRDELLASVRDQELALNEQIRAAEDGLFDMKQEMAMISRALGGQTGHPEEEAA